MANNNSHSSGNNAAIAGIWYLIGNIMIKGVIFITLPIFTRLLSTYDFGLYNSYVAYETIVTCIISLGLYGSIKNAKLDFKEKVHEYTSSIITLGSFVLLASVVILNSIYPLIDSCLPFSAFILNILLFHSYGTFVIQVYNAKLNMEFKYKSYVALASFNTISNVLVSLLLITNVYENQKYIGRILGYALPPILLGALLTIILWNKGKLFINKKYWKYGLAFGLPLLPHLLSQTVISQFDRVMIQNMVGSSEAGIYSFVHTICTILYIVHQSLGSAWTPWIYYKIAAGDIQTIRNKSSLYILLSSILTIGFMCVSPEIIKLMAAKEYWEGMSILVPVTLCMYFIFLYGLPISIEYYNKKTLYTSIGTIGTSIINVLLNYLFIKSYGYKAAAYTTVFSYSLLFTFHIIIAKRLCFAMYYNLKWLFACIVAVLGISAILLLTMQNIILRYLIIISIFIYTFAKRKEISSLVFITKDTH